MSLSRWDIFFCHLVSFPATICLIPGHHVAARSCVLNLTLCLPGSLGMCYHSLSCPVHAASAFSNIFVSIYSQTKAAVCNTVPQGKARWDLVQGQQELCWYAKWRCMSEDLEERPPQSQMFILQFRKKPFASLVILKIPILFSPFIPTLTTHTRTTIRRWLGSGAGL